jgi:hypothetical protein
MRGFDSCYSCFMKKLLISAVRQQKNTYVKKKFPLNTKTYTKRFNLNRKNYRPIFFKKKNLLLKPNAATDIYTYIPYNDYYSYNHLQQISLTNSPKLLNLIKPVISNFYRSKLPYNNVAVDLPVVTSKKLSINLYFNITNMYSINSLIDYYLSNYVLSRYRIHSKKASIIIAQIIDSGHFSKRTVYLSNTQSTSLKYKTKLTNYFTSYTPIPYSINPTLVLSRSLTPLDFNFYPIKELTSTKQFNSKTTLNNLTTLEGLLTNLLGLVWLRHKEVKPRKFSKYFQKYFLYKNRRFKKFSFVNQYRSIFFTLKKIIRVQSQEQLNFLWQKKKINWSSKRKLEVQFFNSFTKLPLKYKKLITKLKVVLPIDKKKISTFIPFNYDLLKLQSKLKSTVYNTLTLPSHTLPVTSLQLSLLYILQPWLINTLVNPSTFKNNSEFLLSQLSIPVNLSYTNLQPHKSFKYITSKKILSLFSTNKIREDVIPLYYNTLIRFMEHCSGKKIFIQLYPFLNQNVTYDYIVRYKSWITRMKSYERRLGHKFFFEEALHIMHLSFTLRDSTLFSSWLKAMILRISFWKTRTIFRFLRYLFLIYFVHIFPELQIKGLKIRLKGKISAAGNSRKRTILYRVGQTSHSKLNLRVSHSKQTINTFTGVMGFQVWLFY